MDDYNGILNHNDLNIIFLNFILFFNSLNLIGSKYREKKFCNPFCPRWYTLKDFHPSKLI